MMLGVRTGIIYGILGTIVAAICSLILGGSLVQGQGYFERDNPLVGGSSADAEVGGVQVPGTDGGSITDDAFVNVVKGAVNWVLGILALIALLVVMWGGFQMVTANGDEGKYTMGFTILKQAAIGLVLIGVAWFIISIIFFVIEITTSNAGPAGTDG